MSSDTSNSTFYTGEYCHGIDPKNRVTIPSAWRSGEAEVFKIRVDSTSSCLLVFTAAEFRRVVEEAATVANISPRERHQFTRQFAGQALESSADKQGRMVLPPELSKQIGLDGEVVMVGSFSRFEIWNPEKWQATKAADASAYNNVASQLGL